MRTATGFVAALTDSRGISKVLILIDPGLGHLVELQGFLRIDHRTVLFLPDSLTEMLPNKILE